jgi:8-oxo-dGTP diphosphatase
MVSGRRASSRRGERGRQSRRGPQRLFVVAALLERGDRVLLSQRRADQSWPLCWEFPGGKVEPGESAEAALVGEMVELVCHSYPEFDLVMPVYRASLARGTPRAVTVAAIAWVPRRRLRELSMPPADIPFARRLARWRRPALPAAARAREGVARPGAQRPGGVAGRVGPKSPKGSTLPGFPSTTSRTRGPRRARGTCVPSSRRSSRPVRRS